MEKKHPAEMKLFIKAKWWNISCKRCIWYHYLPLCNFFSSKSICICGTVWAMHTVGSFIKKRKSVDTLKSWMPAREDQVKCRCNAKLSRNTQWKSPVKVSAVHIVSTCWDNSKKLSQHFHQECWFHPGVIPGDSGYQQQKSQMEIWMFKSRLEISFGVSICLTFLYWFVINRGISDKIISQDATVTIFITRRLWDRIFFQCHY